jgi:hypothetical protein
MQRVPLWGSRRSWQRHVDEIFVRAAAEGRATAVEVDAGRVRWWRQRRRLRRMYGVAATRVDGKRWRLTRELG